MHVSALFLYPVKSMSGHSVSSASLGSFGFVDDRRFMVVDGEGSFATQRHYPLMAKITPNLSGDSLLLVCDQKEPLELRIDSFRDHMEVRVWGDSVLAELCADSRASDWLSSLLGFDAHLVRMPSNSRRYVDPEFAKHGELVSFADGFPLLLCSEASLSDLNARLEKPIAMGRFRPNIVISGTEPYAESEWKKIRIGEVELEVVKPCSRCSMTTLDEHGNFNKEPLKTLATYRRSEYGVCFGENLLIRNLGDLRVGDEVTVLE